MGIWQSITHLLGAINVISEGEEGIRGDTHPSQLLQPLSALLLGEWLHWFAEEITRVLGYLCSKYPGHKHIHNIRLLRPTNTCLPGEIQHALMLSEPP